MTFSLAGKVFLFHVEKGSWQNTCWKLSSANDALYAIAVSKNMQRFNLWEKFSFQFSTVMGKARKMLSLHFIWMRAEKNSLIPPTSPRLTIKQNYINFLPAKNNLLNFLPLINYARKKFRDCKKIPSWDFNLITKAMCFLCHRSVNRKKMFQTFLRFFINLMQIPFLRCL